MNTVRIIKLVDDQLYLQDILLLHRLIKSGSLSINIDDIEEAMIYNIHRINEDIKLILNNNDCPSILFNPFTTRSPFYVIRPDYWELETSYPSTLIRRDTIQGFNNGHVIFSFNKINDKHYSGIEYKPNNQWYYGHREVHLFNVEDRMNIVTVYRDINDGHVKLIEAMGEDDESIVYRQNEEINYDDHEDGENDKLLQCLTTVKNLHR